MDINGFPVEWLKKINEIVYKVIEAVIFSKSIDTRINEFGKSLHNELKLPYFKFKLNYKRRFSSFIKYIRGEYNSLFTQLLNEYLYQVIKESIKINNSRYSKEVFILFIIASYRDKLKFSIGRTDIDISAEPYLEITRHIRGNLYMKTILASLYNIYISGVAERDMLDLLKKAEEILGEINADIFLDTIESIIKRSSLSPTFFLKLYNDIVRTIGEKEKILKVLDRIEQRLHLVASHRIDVNRLLMLIELMKRKFRPHKNTYILILIVREQMYNLLKTSQKLFKQEVSVRTSRLRFKPMRKIPMKYLREIENKLFGLDQEFHVLKTISGIVWPFGIIREIKGMARLGVLYLVESDTANSQLLWSAFVDEVLSREAKKLAFSGIIIPISPKTTFIYEERSIESPLSPRQIYHKETYTEGKRKKRFLKYIEVEESIKETKVQYLLNILFNLVKEIKHYELHWTQNDVIKFSNLLRESLRLSDLVSEFPLSNNAIDKIDKLEDRIISALNQEFPALKIEGPLDIWVLYKDKELRKRAMSIIRSFLPDISNNPELIALDMLEKAYIVSMLGPYIQQGKLREYIVFEKTFLCSFYKSPINVRKIIVVK